MTATAESSAAVPPPRPPRPGTVTVAFWLQIAAVLILLGLVALLVVEAIQWDAAIDRAVRQVPGADPDEVRAERWSSLAMVAVPGVLALLLALWLGLTAPGVRRGSNTARTMVFVAGGLQLLLCVVQGCAGALLIPFGLAFAVAEGPYVDETYPDGVPPEEDDFWQESDFAEALYGETGLLDSVLFPLAGLGVLLVFLLTAAVVLLLVLPPAHRWFVPRAEPATPWPPTGGGDVPNAYLAGYPMPPGHPGYPPPGYPVPPGYPPPGYPMMPGHFPFGPAVPGYPPSGYVLPPGYPPPAVPPAPDDATASGGGTGTPDGGGSGGTASGESGEGGR